MYIYSMGNDNNDRKFTNESSVLDSIKTVISFEHYRNVVLR